MIKENTEIKTELEEDKQNDPIEKFVTRLKNDKIISDDEYQKIGKEINVEIDEAADKAFKLSDPDPKRCSEICL